MSITNPKRATRRGTKLVQCCFCKRTIVAEVPEGLKGDFAHVRCAGPRKVYEVLSAEFLS